MKILKLILKITIYLLTIFIIFVTCFNLENTLVGFNKEEKEVVNKCYYQEDNDVLIYLQNGNIAYFFEEDFLKITSFYYTFSKQHIYIYEDESLIKYDFIILKNGLYEKEEYSFYKFVDLPIEQIEEIL